MKMKKIIKIEKISFQHEIKLSNILVQVCITIKALLTIGRQREGI